MIRQSAALIATVATLGVLPSANAAAAPVDSGREKIAATDTAQSDGTKVAPELTPDRSHALLGS